MEHRSNSARPFGRNKKQGKKIERQKNRRRRKRRANFRGSIFLPRMQHSAMNRSETAFIVPGESGFGLRWFTPTVEVDLCGHATLASAHLLWEQGFAAMGEPIRFQTHSGLLTCSGVRGKIELDFPSEPAERIAPLAELTLALGAQPVSLGRNRFDLIAEFESEERVRALRPDFGLLGKIP